MLILLKSPLIFFKLFLLLGTINSGACGESKEKNKHELVNVKNDDGEKRHSDQIEKQLPLENSASPEPSPAINEALVPPIVDPSLYPSLTDGGASPVGYPSEALPITFGIVPSDWSCPSECCKDFDCYDDNPCTIDKCLHGRCQYEPFPDCIACSETSDCPLFFACDVMLKKCTTACSESQTCNGGCCNGGTCVSGTQQTACGNIGDACVSCVGNPSGSACVAGVCGCVADADCPGGFVCNSITNLCVPAF